MKPITHQQAQMMLQSGTALAKDDQASLSAHLAGCPDCREFAAFHNVLTEDLPQAFPMKHHAEREIRQKARAMHSRLENRSWTSWFFQGTRSAFALTTLLMVAIGLTFMAFQLLAQQIGGRQPIHADPLTSIEETQAAATAAVPLPQATPMPAAYQVTMREFPLNPGTTWVYSRTEYSQAEDDPQTILQSTWEITERVTSVQIHQPYTIVHVQRNETMLSADPGWNGTGEGTYEFWYVLQGGKVYRSNTAPNAANVQTKQMELVFEFPLAVGNEWCATELRKGTVDQPTPDASAPCPAPRKVTTTTTYQSPIGSLEGCYEIQEVYASGSVITQFCQGVGVVAMRYGHNGSQFGYSQEISSFTNPDTGPVASVQTSLNTPTAELVANQSGASISGVFQHGHIGYIGEGTQLVAVDLSQPGYPKWLAESEILNSPITRVIKLPDADYPKAAAAAGNTLAIFDITQPDAIPLLSRFTLPGQVASMILDIHPRKLYVSGPLDEPDDTHQGYVAIIDVNNAERPVLLDLIQTEQALQSLALSQPVLFASPAHTEGGVVAMRLTNNELGDPIRVIPSLTVRSMTAVRDQLYIGADGSLLAYDISDPAKPQQLWNINSTGTETPLGVINGFLLRSDTIFAAGGYSAGFEPPFRLALTPPAPVNTGSTVDTGSTLSVGAGLMLVTGGHLLEIYDVRDPANIKWIASYPQKGQ